MLKVGPVFAGTVPPKQHTWNCLDPYMHQIHFIQIKARLYSVYFLRLFVYTAVIPHALHFIIAHFINFKKNAHKLRCRPLGTFQSHESIVSEVIINFMIVKIWNNKVIVWCNVLTKQVSLYAYFYFPFKMHSNRPRIFRPFSIT